MLAFLLPVAAAAAGGDVYTGVARVGDGDSLTLLRGGSGMDIRIRLYGIDAPELDQECRDARGRNYPCGVVSERRLAALVEGRRVACEERDRDQYDRIVAICRLGDVDLNDLLVGEGHAVAFLAFSARYVASERAARAAGVGIWAGEAIAPSEHRASSREERRRQIADAGPLGCSIKGNISRSGRRLYHTPDGHSWADTVIDTSAGERWFCTESEARAAGWERAGR